MQNLTKEVIKTAANFAKLGLLPATSGNLSIKLNQEEILITESGKDKSKLNQDDFVKINRDGQAIDSDKKPSAETLLHTQLYKWQESIQAVFHIHSPASVIISKIIGAGKEIKLHNYELLKALGGVQDHLHTEVIPIFKNTQRIPLLASEVEQFLKVKPDTHAYIIEGHGLYTWGPGIEQTTKHVEAIETLLNCELQLIR